MACNDRLSQNGSAGHCAIDPLSLVDPWSSALGQPSSAVAAASSAPQAVDPDGVAKQVEQNSWSLGSDSDSAAWRESVGTGLRHQSSASTPDHVSSTSAGSSSDGPIDQRQPLDDHRSQRCQVLMQVRNCQPEELDSYLDNHAIGASTISGDDSSQAATYSSNMPVSVEDVRAVPWFTHQAHLKEMLMRPNGFTAIVESGLNLYKLWCKLPYNAPDPHQQAQSVAAPVVPDTPIQLQEIGPWKRIFDAVYTQKHYWHNSITGESVWQLPAYIQVYPMTPAAAGHLPNPAGIGQAVTPDPQQLGRSPWAEPLPSQPMRSPWAEPQPTHSMRSPWAEPQNAVQKSDGEPTMAGSSRDAVIPPSHSDGPADLAACSVGASGNSVPKVERSENPDELQVASSPSVSASQHSSAARVDDVTPDERVPVRNPRELLVSLLRNADDVQPSASSSFDVSLPLPLGADVPEDAASSSVPPAPANDTDAAQAVNLASFLHGTGQCRPCAWFYLPVGCRDGASCQFCHLCPPRERDARRMARATARATMQRIVEVEENAASASAARPPAAEDLGADQVKEEVQLSARSGNWMRAVMDGRSLRQPRKCPPKKPQNEDVQPREGSTCVTAEDMDGRSKPFAQPSNDIVQPRESSDNQMGEVMDGQSPRQPRNNPHSQPQNIGVQPTERSANWMREVMDDRSLRQPGRDTVAQPQNGNGQPGAWSDKPVSEVADGLSFSVPPCEPPAQDCGGRCSSAAGRQAGAIGDDQWMGIGHQCLRHRQNTSVEEAAAAADMEGIATPAVHTWQSDWQQPSTDVRPALQTPVPVDSGSKAASSSDDPTPLASMQDDDDTSSDEEEGAAFWYCS